MTQIDIAALVASALCRDGVPEGSLHDQDRAWMKKLRFAHHQEELAHDL